MNHSLWMNKKGVSVVNEHSALGHLVIWAESRHLDIMIYPTWYAEGCSRWSLFLHWLIPNKMNSPFGSTIWGICCRTFEGPLSQIRKKQAVLDVCPKMSGTTLDVSERNWRKEPPIRRSNGPTLKMAWFFWVPGIQTRLVWPRSRTRFSRTHDVEPRIHMEMGYSGAFKGPKPLQVTQSSLKKLSHMVVS